jgi:hypothetical protein
LDLSSFNLSIPFQRQSRNCCVIHLRGGQGWVLEAFPKRPSQQCPLLCRQAQCFGRNLVYTHTQRLHENIRKESQFFFLSRL